MHKLLLLAFLIGSTVRTDVGATSNERNCSRGCEEERATATVERVFKAEDKGFGFVSYQVTWRGHAVVVSDPVRWTDLAVGDKVRFHVFEHDMTAEAGGKRLLGFVVTKEQ